MSRAGIMRKAVRKRMNKIKENWSNIKRVLRVIQKIDRHYFHWVMVTHVINAAGTVYAFVSVFVCNWMAWQTEKVFAS